jgi:hypothetical protein
MTLISIVEEFRSIVGNEWFLDTPKDLVTYSCDYPTGPVT